MSVQNTVNYVNITYTSGTMQWATVDADQFNRTHVANTAEALEQHDHTNGKGVGVGALSTTITLTNGGDVKVGAALIQYKDSGGTTHSVAALDTTNTYGAAGISDHSAQTGANSFLVPVIAGAAPTTSGAIAYDSTANAFIVGVNGTAQNLSGAPTGATIPFAGTTLPAGWLWADGSSQLRATYAALFTQIGTTWGAADGSHFNVPDGRSYIFMGADNYGQGARGLTSVALGANSGADTITLTASQLPALAYTSSLLDTTINVSEAPHSHTEQYSSGSGGAINGGNRNFPTGNVLDTGGNVATAAALTGITASMANGTVTVSTNAGGGSHSNRQLSAGMRHITKY